MIQSACRIFRMERSIHYSSSKGEMQEPGWDGGDS